MKARIRINQQITTPELRVIGPAGENFGILATREALEKAAALGTDLIEISPNAKPPIAKIMDFGKYQYLQNKKERGSKSHATETKNLQVKIGTGEHDLERKARIASDFLVEGHRVKIDLFLPGRAKYLDKNFLQERLERFLRFMTTPYRVADPAKKSPKGLTIIIEKQK